MSPFGPIQMTLLTLFGWCKFVHIVLPSVLPKNGQLIPFLCRVFSMIFGAAAKSVFEKICSLGIEVAEETVEVPMR